MTPQWAKDNHIFNKWFISFVFTEKPQNIGIYNLPFFKSRWKLVNSSQTFERNWLLFSLKVWASNPRRWISEKKSHYEFRRPTSMSVTVFGDATKRCCHDLNFVANILKLSSTWQSSMWTGWSAWFNVDDSKVNEPDGEQFCQKTARLSHELGDQIWNSLWRP